MNKDKDILDAGQPDASLPPVATTAESFIVRFWRELRRRKVMRVATVYAIVAWLVIQIAANTFPSLHIPGWALSFVVMCVLLGFPVAIVVAWAFELTPEGIKTSKAARVQRPPHAEHESHARKRNWTAIVFAAIMPTLIFGSLALYFFITSSGSVSGQASEVAETNQSIAVMPLVNMSSHEENAYFAGGIHEDVLTNLSRIKNLQVKSRTSMLKYAASDMTLGEIGKELGLNYIVEGSVRRIGNHVRVTIQLIDASNENHLWANNFERELVDVFATQSELAREISNSLHLEIQPESVDKLEGMPTTSVKAYDLYTRAASLEKTEGRTEEALMRRRNMLEQAVAEDPDFVEAWAVLKRLYDNQLNRVRGAGWYVNEGGSLKAVVEELTAKSKRAWDKAMALDPDNVETLLSGVVDYVWPKTYEEMQEQKAIFDHLVATHPEHAKSWYHLGWWYSKLGELPGQDVESAQASAVTAFEKALSLDPFNARIVRAVLNWYRQREYQEDVTRLVERLTQIIPETKNERNLARVSLQARTSRALDAFLATADEDYLEEFAKFAEERRATGDYIFPASEAWSEISQRVFTNELDKLLELSRKSIAIEESMRHVVVFYMYKDAALSVYKVRGQMEQARTIAREILKSEENALSQGWDPYGNIRIAQAEAHVVLGEFDDALQLVEDLLADPNFQGDTYYARRIAAMSWIDVNRAVELAFSEKAKHQKWGGFDGIAAFHLWSRPLLAHPKVQAYYVKEGKWINYLSKRVPEYAKYQGKDAR